MNSDKPRKSCYNCTKRRIVCDLTPPKCNKCAKKGLECPGFGIRYRFADAKTAPSSEPELSENPSASSSTSTTRRQRDLQWIDVSNRPRKKGRRKGDGASAVGSTTSAGSKSRSEDQTVSTPPVTVHNSGTIEQERSIVVGSESQNDSPGSEGVSSPFRASETPRLPSADPDDADVEEIISTNELTVPDLSDVPHMLLSLPPLLSNPDPRMRLLINHFSTHVSPVMVMYDDESNGYRNQILPLAHCDPIVERAVCVVSAFHLSRRMPELRLPAENGRAAIIRKMVESPFDLSDSAWATLLLLIVADLVTGHEHVMTLYRMLVAFLDARGHQGLYQSPLSVFLFFQTRLISFFAYPFLGGSKAVEDFSQVLKDPLGSFEQYAPRGRRSYDFLLLAVSSQPPSSFPLDAMTKMFVEVVHDATEIYLLRARASDDSSCATEPVDVGDSPPQSSLSNTDTTTASSEDLCRLSIATQTRVKRIRNLLEQIGPSAPGAHTMVWPSFIAAAESREDDDREFFSAILRRIWVSTGYDNVLRALNELPRIWERQERGQRWTAALPNLKTVVM